MKKKRLLKQSKTFLLLNLCLLFSVHLLSQEKIALSGTVFSDDNRPLLGVSITLKGGKKGTFTDTTGKFSIIVNKGSTLVFAYIGHKIKEIVINNEKSASKVLLVSNFTDLGDVVVIGYGSVKKSDVTGSVSSISQKDLDKVSGSTFDLLLQGRVAGVNVTQTSAEPNGNVSIRIRGSNSISGNNEPLYVVDGYPLPTGGEASGDGWGQPSNALSGINPNDIQSIEVLKDASAAAIYGSRGANGVVLITTKKGSVGLVKIQYSARVGASDLGRPVKLMNAREFAQNWNDDQISRGLNPSYNGSSPAFPKPDSAGEGTNWIKAITRTGITQNHQLSISGGSKEFKYNISGSIYQNNGIILNSNFSRYNFKINLDNKLSEKLNISTTLNYSNSSLNGIQQGTGAVINVSGPIFYAQQSSPLLPVDAPLTTKGNNTGQVLFNNPVTTVKDRKDVTQNKDLNATVLAVYKISNAISLNLRGGTTSRNSIHQIYYPLTSSQGFNNKGQAFSNSYSSEDQIFECFLNYQKAINNKNKLDLTGGYTFQTNTTRTQNVTVTNFPYDFLGFDALQLGTSYFATPTSKTLRTLQSFYARTNYTLLNRYLFTFTGRADGSSVCAQNNKWGYFPSGAFAWKLSQEPFFPKNKIVNNVKIRVSYGLTGNQGIGPLGSLALLNVANYTTTSQQISGLAPTSLGNPDLKWETTTTSNLGGDFSFFKDKLNLTIEFYQKTTKDLLQSLQLPLSSGFGTGLANLGSIENKGIEIQLSGNVIKKKKFNWSSSFNISFNRSKILNLGPKTYLLGRAAGSNYLNSPANIMQVGQPYGMFYGLKALRLIQASDFDANKQPTFATFNGVQKLGQWLIQDVDTSKVIDDGDRQIIGNPNPKFTYGFNNDFSYEKFHLSIFVQGVYGNQIMNLNNAFIRSGLPISNQTKDWLTNHWTPANPTNDIRYPSYGTGITSLTSGNYFLEDGSFLRLKNVTFSYDISKIGKVIKSGSVFLSATNLITITNYSGFDPEVNIYGQANNAVGIDLGSYPRSRTYEMGVNLNF